jgi:hypothetical protein
MEGVECMENQAAVMQLVRKAMPGVARLVAEQRRLHGDAHVTQCIHRSFEGKPGYFFAREGALAVGTPWDGDPELAIFSAKTYTATQALVLMRAPEGADHG